MGKGSTPAAGVMWGTTQPASQHTLLLLLLVALLHLCSALVVQGTVHPHFPTHRRTLPCRARSPRGVPPPPPMCPAAQTCSSSSLGLGYIGRPGEELIAIDPEFAGPTGPLDVSPRPSTWCNVYSLHTPRYPPRTPACITHIHPHGSLQYTCTSSPS